MPRRGPTRFSRQRQRVRRTLLALAAMGVLAVMVSATLVSDALQVSRIAVNGITVPQAEVAEWGTGYAERWASTEVTLRVGDGTHRVSRRELGASLPLSSLLEAVDSGLENADPEEESIPSVKWAPEVEHASLLQKVFEIRERTTDGIDASQTIDLHSALKTLKNALFGSTLALELPLHKRPVRSAVTEWEPGAFAHMLGRHTSSYRPTGRSWGRGHNIQAAAEALDGLVIEPRGVLSFNEVVGQRSFQRGFMGAKEIARGRVVNGIGGGVCQVATALHDAALQSAFTIGEHYVHSKRPRYARRGIDSAVAWGLKDLTIQNPYNQHVRVRAKAQAGRLVVGLWSSRKPPKVEISTNVVQGQLRARHELMLVERRRTVHWKTGARTDVKTLRYPAEPRD